MSLTIELLQWMRKRLATRRRREELQGLDERTLKDIGIDRSEISSIEAELYRFAQRTRRNLACCE
jgi:uncharacterized protein YjiS (DUF1127 family)